MKKLLKLSLLLVSIPLALSSCEDFAKKAYCLETFNSEDYEAGMCYQAASGNVLESLFVMNLPINPEDDPENYKYDLTWNDNINLAFFTCVGGLKGKKISTILKLGAQTLKVTISGSCNDKEATSGYIRVNRNAFKAHTERVTDADVYAYVAIGTRSGVTEKPTENNENNSQSSSSSAI